MKFFIFCFNFKSLFTYHVNIILEIFQNGCKLAIYRDGIPLKIKNIIYSFMIINQNFLKNLIEVFAMTSISFGYRGIFS